MFCTIAGKIQKCSVSYQWVCAIWEKLLEKESLKMKKLKEEVKPEVRSKTDEQKTNVREFFLLIEFQWTEKSWKSDDWTTATVPPLNLLSIFNFRFQRRRPAFSRDRPVPFTGRSQGLRVRPLGQWAWRLCMLSLLEINSERMRRKNCWCLYLNHIP